jgi:two-component system LytT family response regulator
MKVLIIEDESPAARRLKQLLSACPHNIEVISIIESIAHAVDWISSNSSPDLIFMDIQLADGQSFEIFNHATINCPVIFTTAYDEYALKAFKLNGIEYLLKPIAQEDLNQALNKYLMLKKENSKPSLNENNVNYELLDRFIQEIGTNKPYKSRLLIKIGDKMMTLPVDQIAYFISEDKLVHAISFDGKKHPLDYSLEDLETMLDPKSFFRINRQFIAKINAIQSVHNYFNGKLKLFLTPTTSKEVVVSREKANQFKQWLEV